jgi:catechol 2,3-dioxygenase-like lactoylglutathione lyase family enzyme
MHINRITLLCHDLDAAIQFYVDAFGFTLIEDTHVSNQKRIVRVAPSRSGASFNLAAAKPGDEPCIGHQTGQRVAVFIDVDALDPCLERFRQHGVYIIDGPRTEPFGRCLLVQDLSGNTWEFVERRDVETART